MRGGGGRRREGVRGGEKEVVKAVDNNSCHLPHQYHQGDSAHLLTAFEAFFNDKQINFQNTGYLHSQA